MRRELALLLILLALPACGQSSAVKTFCADVRAAEAQPYSQSMFETLQRDFPYQPGDSGYTAANDAANAYQPGDNTVFLTKASVYLTGWCGGP